MFFLVRWCFFRIDDLQSLFLVELDSKIDNFFSNRILSNHISRHETDFLTIGLDGFYYSDDTGTYDTRKTAGR